MVLLLPGVLEANAIDFQQEGLEIVQLTSYKLQDEPYEEYQILGEVRNTLDIPLTISGTFLDGRTNCQYLYPEYSYTLEKETLWEDSCILFAGAGGSSADYVYVPPGEKIPFSFTALDALENLQNIHLEFKVERAEPKEVLLEICCVSVEKISGPYGGVEIKGKVINKSTQLTNVDSVFVSIYDKNGSILDSTGSTVVGSFLSPSQTQSDGGEFQVFLDENPENAEKFSSYRIIAESEEYTSVPEFSSLVLIILGISISVVLFYNKFKF